MCVRIIWDTHSELFNSSLPIGGQLVNAKEVFIDYHPYNPDIQDFVSKLNNVCDFGFSSKVEINFDSNNYLEGFKVEREIESIKRKIEINSVVKEISKLHSITDKKLNELSNFCLGK